MIVQIKPAIGTCICVFLLQFIEIKSLPETENAATASNLKNATAIAMQKCEEYSEYRNVKKWIPAMASKPGYWYNTTDCVNVAPLIVGGTHTKPKEYPHMARIGYAKDDDIKNVNWVCGGSLISEKFILSTAVCGEGTSSLKPHWAVLGDLDVSSTSDDARPATYDIVRVHNHPNYKSPSPAYDIALFELNTNVAMSPYIRPACLYTSNSDLANTRGSITGWGITAQGEKPSDHLLKAVITVLGDEQCSAVYNISSNKFIYNSSSMICAGDLKDGNDACQGDSGGPLQMPLKDQTCMWTIFGLTSFGKQCGNPKYPGVYTKVTYYLDWIQSIVWP